MLYSMRHDLMLIVNRAAFSMLHAEKKEALDCEVHHYWLEKLNVGRENHKHSRIEWNGLFFNKLSKKATVQLTSIVTL